MDNIPQYEEHSPMVFEFADPIIGRNAKSAGRSLSLATSVIDIIGAASGLGAPDKGCALGPEVLNQIGLAETLRKHGISTTWQEILRRPVSTRNSVDFLVLRDFCTDLLDCVLASLRGGHQFVVIGGDHSCAIGTWSAASWAIRDQGSLGLIWIDAHMDSHTPATSPSGAAHGMPLACLLGYGAPELTQLVDPKLKPNQVCLIGVRSYEEEEAHLLKQLGVRVIFMEEVQTHGLAWAMQEALEIACKETAGYGLSLDLDAIDPKAAPGVGTPAPEGLQGQELVACMGLLTHRRGFLGLEIAEYNPLHDQDNRTARLVCDLVHASFAEVRENTYGTNDY